MPIEESEFEGEELWAAFPSLVIRPDDKIEGQDYGFLVDLEGIKGGTGDDAQNRMVYRCYFDIADFPDDDPQVWITNYSDDEIVHINIFHNTECPRLDNGQLPEVCTGTLDQFLEAVNERNIFGIIISIKQILNAQNFDSPAR